MMELKNHHFAIFNHIPNPGNDYQWVKLSNEILEIKKRKFNGELSSGGIKLLPSLPSLSILPSLKHGVSPDMIQWQYLP